MPQKNPSSRRVITPLLLFTLAGWALWALGRNEPTAASTAETVPARGPEPASARPRERVTWSRRRMATSLAFVTLFFAGAAFSAGAGDVVVGALEDTTASETASTESEPAGEEQAPADDQAAEAEGTDGEAAEGEPAESEPAEGELPASDDAEAPSEDQEQAEPADDPAPEGEGEGDDGSSPQDGAPADPGDEPAANDDEGNESSPTGGGQPSGGSEDDDEAPAPHLDEGEDDPSSQPPAESTLLDGPDGPSQLDPEASAEGFFATVWLHRALPDPTPPAKRLTPLFAKTLGREANRAHVDWALLLGVLRASGFDSSSMSTTGVRRAADRLVALGVRRNQWRALLGYRGRTTFADKALALTRYNRAVGLRSLVTGLVAAKPALQQKVLRDSRLHVYPAGRLDVAMGRIDVRVLVLLEYLAEAHGEVTVSSLFSGHRLYARPGVVSAHVYGLAVDVAALGGTPIAGHQEPNGLTERAVRNILLLPAELQPRQVISLLGLGGPSFPLADHGDHIHVGY